MENRLRAMAGVALVALPFAIILATCFALGGWKAMFLVAGMFAGAGLTVASILLGIELLD